MRAFCGLLAATLLLIGAAPVPAAAHGGLPMRLGVASEPQLLILSQVIAVALRDGAGLSVERKVFPDRAALQEAWRALGMDLQLDLPAEEARRAGNVPEAACGDGIAGIVAEAYRNADGPAAVEFFGFSLTGSLCGRPGVVVRRAVVDNLRFAMLRDVVRRAMAAVRKDDLERLASAAAVSERALLQAVRELLARP